MLSNSSVAPELAVNFPPVLLPASLIEKSPLVTLTVPLSLKTTPN